MNMQRLCAIVTCQKMTADDWIRAGWSVSFRHVGAVTYFFDPDPTKTITAAIAASDNVASLEALRALEALPRQPTHTLMEGPRITPHVLLSSPSDL